MEELLADEDIPRPIVEKLRSEGYRVHYIEEEAKGSTDREVLKESRDNKLPILTYDNDFFKFSNHPGILHITSRTNYDRTVNAIKEVINHLTREETENCIIRINPSEYS